jgi:hypothetical protein
LDSFAVNNIDCRKAGLTISYDGCWFIHVHKSSILGTNFLSRTFFVRFSYNKISSRDGGVSLFYLIK